MSIRLGINKTNAAIHPILNVQLVKCIVSCIAVLGWPLHQSHCVALCCVVHCILWCDFFFCCGHLINSSFQFADLYCVLLCCVLHCRVVQPHRLHGIALHCIGFCVLNWNIGLATSSAHHLHCVGKFQRGVVTN